MLSSLRKAESTVFFFLLLLLPTQAGRHFWPKFSYVSGIRVDYLSPTVYFTDILLLILLGVWFIRTFKLKVKKFQISNFKYQINSKLLNLKNPKLLLFPVLILFFINPVFAGRPMLAFMGIARLVFLALFSFYIVRNLFSYRYSNILYALSLGVIFESTLSIFQSLNQGSLGGLMYFFGEREFFATSIGVANASIMGNLVLRPYGTFSHPNTLAGYLVLVMIMLCFGVFLKTSFSKKIIFGASVIIGSVVLLISLSRGAIIIWLVFLIVFFLLKVRKLEQRKKIILSFAVVIAMGIFIVFAFAPVGLRFRETSISEEAFSLRGKGFITAASMIAEKPILGEGINNFIAGLPRFEKKQENIFYLQPVHNIFLLVTAETGIVGIIFCLFLFVKTFKRVIAKNSFFRFQNVALLVVIIALGMFDHYLLTQQQGRLLLAFVFGLCWAKNTNLS